MKRKKEKKKKRTRLGKPMSGGGPLAFVFRPGTDQSISIEIQFYSMLSIIQLTKWWEIIIISRKNKQANQRFLVFIRHLRRRRLLI